MPPLPHHPFRFSTPIGPQTSGQGLKEAARRLEDQGYSTVTVSDHFDNQFGPIATLTSIAEATSTLQLASLVFSNDYRHPAVLAKEAATVDLLSDGRLEFGMGAGWMTTDYESTGIPLDPPSVRIERLAEALTVVKGLWADGPVEFDGVHYQVHGLEGTPKPHQSPRPPIALGGGGRKILQLAAREADIVGLNPTMTSGAIDITTGQTATAKHTDDRVGWIRDAAGDRFTELELHVRMHLVIVTDDADALFTELSAGFGLTPEEARSTPHALAGSPEEMADTLRERRERWGISYIGVPADAADDMAPVVALLAGT